MLLPNTSEILTQTWPLSSRRVSLNMLSSSVTLQNAANTIGNALETEVRLTAFEKANIDEFRKANKATEDINNEHRKWIIFCYIAGKNNVDLPTWPTRDKLLVGQKLIEIVVDTTGYLEVVADYRSHATKKAIGGAYTYHIIGSEKCLQWIPTKSFSAWRRLDSRQGRTFGLQTDTPSRELCVQNSSTHHKTRENFQTRSRCRQF